MSLMVTSTWQHVAVTENSRHNVNIYYYYNNRGSNSQAKSVGRKWQIPQATVYLIIHDAWCRITPSAISLCLVFFTALGPWPLTFRVPYRLSLSLYIYIYIYYLYILSYLFAHQSSTFPIMVLFRWHTLLCLPLSQNNTIHYSNLFPFLSFPFLSLLPLLSSLPFSFPNLLRKTDNDWETCSWIHWLGNNNKH